MWVDLSEHEIFVLRGIMARVEPVLNERLEFDHKVHETSPVVKGTWITVDHVTDLIAKGWRWRDILWTHPNLTEDDIRACLTYNVSKGVKV